MYNADGYLAQTAANALWPHLKKFLDDGDVMTLAARIAESVSSVEVTKKAQEDIAQLQREMLEVAAKSAQDAYDSHVVIKYAKNAQRECCSFRYCSTNANYRLWDGVKFAPFCKRHVKEQAIISTFEPVLKKYNERAELIRNTVPVGMKGQVSHRFDRWQVSGKLGW